MVASLALGTGAGLWWTRDSVPAPTPEGAGAAKGQQRPAAGSLAQAYRRGWVDMSPLLTARRMSSLATTPEEQEFARQAERLADHSVDLAFAEAMRQATDEQPATTPQIKELAARKAKAQAAVEADQRDIDRLTAQAAATPPAAPGEEGDRQRDRLEVARAQLELDRDELNLAAEDLERAGGDPQARIRRLKEVYDAAQKEPRAVAAAASGAPAAAVSEPTSLAARLRGWTAQRSKREQLAGAMREAREKAARLETWHGRLEQRIAAAAPQREAARQAAAGIAQGDPLPGAAPEAKTTLASLKQLSADRRRLTVVDQRIQNQRDLADVYSEWRGVVETRARSALHAVLLHVLWLLLTVAAITAASVVADRLVRRIEGDDPRAPTLRTVTKVAIQLGGALVVLFMIFGAPAQATTIIGLAGAGLTVAMKNFIVAFFGWFVLMGRNGLRVGDWVEIEGVGGEVVEIGLLHTVLLETGSWTDAGHPTGRRVSFVNSFAIEGHYFNFSTSGQWMWDELRVLIPSGEDPYPIIDGVQKLTQRETEANAKLAEQEWRKTTTRYRVRSFSAEPGINVVPTSAGVEIEARYITRAFERHETRRKLYQAVFELMHGKRGGGELAGAAG